MKVNFYSKFMNLKKDSLKKPIKSPFYTSETTKSGSW